MRSIIRLAAVLRLVLVYVFLMRLSGCVPLLQYFAVSKTSKLQFSHRASFCLCSFCYPLVNCHSDQWQPTPFHSHLQAEWTPSGNREAKQATKKSGQQSTRCKAVPYAVKKPTVHSKDTENESLPNPATLFLCLFQDEQWNIDPNEWCLGVTSISFFITSCWKAIKKGL